MDGKNSEIKRGLDRLLTAGRRTGYDRCMSSKNQEDKAARQVTLHGHKDLLYFHEQKNGLICHDKPGVGIA